VNAFRSHDRDYCLGGRDGAQVSSPKQKGLIEKATIGGFDWGARTADIIAALWPERCKALVSVSGYLIGGQEAGKIPLPPAAELQWWYQFYFATERGRAARLR